MKYFIIEGTSKTHTLVDKDTLDKALQEHLDFLQKGYDSGYILVAGPKADSGGGIIIMKAMDLEEIERFISNDPLYLADVQEYRIVEFNVHDCQSMVNGWFKSE